MASRLASNYFSVLLPGPSLLLLAKSQTGEGTDMPPFERWTLVQSTTKKSLDTVTQVCEKIFISQIIDLIEQVSKLSRTSAYKC